MIATDKTVLISGVSTGIGLDCARYLMDRGWFVWGSVRKAQDASSLEADYPDQFRTLVFDVRDREAMSSAIATIQNSDRPLQALINNAGIAVPGPIEYVEPAELKKQFDVNVIGLLELTQLTLPLLHQARENGVGPVRIINVSSISGLISSPFVSLYSASKFAVESLTDGLRRELLPFDIDVIAVQPGPIETPIWDKALENDNYQDTRYEAALKMTRERVEQSKKSAMPVEAVSKAIYKALSTKRPKSRYLVVKNKLAIRLVSALPPRFFDRFFR